MKMFLLYNLYLRRLAGVLVGGCAVAVFAYGALLLMAVAHTANLSAAQEGIHTLTSKLSAAESVYLSQTESLNLGSAEAFGLTKPSAVSVVYVATPSLSFNH